MYVRMYVYVLMYMYICTHTHTHIHIHIHAHMYTYISATALPPVRANPIYVLYMHVYINTCMHACIHTYTHTKKICYCLLNSMRVICSRIRSFFLCITFLPGFFFLYPTMQFSFCACISCTPALSPCPHEPDNAKKKTLRAAAAVATTVLVGLP